ncbi:hypothetical protein [Treponema denticola]|uniref:hypothetical protein n=1 Tax=Treponema denticola TaxID=158 RepID=UPI00386DD47B
MNSNIAQLIEELKRKGYNPELYCYNLEKKNSYYVDLVSDTLITSKQLNDLSELLNDIYVHFPKDFNYKFSFFYSETMTIFFDIYKSSFFIKKYKLIISPELKNIHELIHGFASCINCYANKILEEGLAMYLSWVITDSFPQIQSYSIYDLSNLTDCKTDKDYILSGLLVQFLIKNRNDFLRYIVPLFQTI